VTNNLYRGKQNPHTGIVRGTSAIGIRKSAIHRRPVAVPPNSLFRKILPLSHSAPGFCCRAPMSISAKSQKGKILSSRYIPKKNSIRTSGPLPLLATPARSGAPARRIAPRPASARLSPDSTSLAACARRRSGRRGKRCGCRCSRWSSQSRPAFCRRRFRRVFPDRSSPGRAA